MLAQKISLRWFFVLLLLSGCAPRGAHAPSIDVFGSYFPAWLIALAVGVVLTVFTSAAAHVLEIRPPRFLGPLLWVSLILIFSITVWFLFFAT
jgi:YtcA family